MKKHSITNINYAVTHYQTPEDVLRLLTPEKPKKMTKNIKKLKNCKF